MNKQVELANNLIVPAIGQGSWYLGDHAETRASEIEALRGGIAAGMTLLDTAELYGEGRSEELVGEAIRGLDRQKLFLVSKVMPSNAGEDNIFDSCEKSLSRLGTDYLDLYLLHWPGSIPLEETVDCLEKLVAMGKIRAWGVSNFDIAEMEELWKIPKGKNCLVNQVLYHIGSRGIEYSLIPWMRRNEVTLMAYCPLAQAGSLRRGLFQNPVLSQIAQKHHAEVPQIMLAWCVRDGNTIAIPRSSRLAHTLANAAADNILLDAEDLALIDKEFAPPKHKEHLDIQ